MAAPIERDFSRSTVLRIKMTICQHRPSSIARYVSVNLALVLTAGFLFQGLARQLIELDPGAASLAAHRPSRVETFKRAEVAAAMAPHEPVPRIIVARDIPEMPVQVLAVRLDDAEGVKVKPVRVKSKALRLARTAARSKKTLPGSKLPPDVIAIEARNVGESSRDITNRSLGVLVTQSRY
jgi:hypothetical protein